MCLEPMALPFPVEPEDIPTESAESIQENVAAMISYINLGLGQDLGDGDLRTFAEKTLLYARKQLVRFSSSLDEDVDLLAWVGRCLFEMLLLARYALQSQDNLRDVMVRQISEMAELDRAWFDGDPGDRSDPDVASFKESVEAMQAFAEEWDLDVPKRFNQHQLAKETDSLREFHVIYKTLSKYAHPTPMLLFGR